MLIARLRRQGRPNFPSAEVRSKRTLPVVGRGFPTWKYRLSAESFSHYEHERARSQQSGTAVSFAVLPAAVIDTKRPGRDHRRGPASRPSSTDVS